MDKLHSKLHKLLALAKRGQGGEKENAQRMLDKMLAKHGLTMDDLEVEKKRMVWIKYESQHEKLLANQIAHTVCNVHDMPVYQPRGKGNHKQLGFEFTASEHMEFELQYEVLRKALKDTLAIATHAFIQANNIFPTAEYKGEPKPMSDTDHKAYQMSQNIEKTEVHKRLECE